MVKLKLKSLKEAVVSAADIKKYGLSAADIKKRLAPGRVGPPVAGSPEWQMAKRKGETSPIIGGEEEERIRQAIQDVLLDPTVIEMIRSKLQQSSVASAEPTVAGRKKKP